LLRRSPYALRRSKTVFIQRTPALATGAGAARTRAMRAMRRATRPRWYAQSTVAALIAFAGALMGCADLLGTDFSGDPRGADASSNDGEAPGGDEDGGTGLGHDASGDGPTPDTNAADGSGGGDAGVSVYCGFPDDSGTECLCTNSPSTGVTLGAKCSAQSVAAPSLCCAVQGWPSTNIAPGWPGCACSSIFCEVDAFGDVCQCGFGAPTAGDKPVTNCSGWSNCCRSKSTFAPTCACYKQTVPCENGDESVPSCAPSDLRCADLSVQACH
jgi:hypothetical protein